MESIETRYNALIKCLKSLRESLDLLKREQDNPLHKALRDSSIQRFEFTIDTFWKYLKEYLETKHGVTFTFVTPREVLRLALRASVLTAKEYDIFTEMIRDRNQTSHTYNETLAEQINSKLEGYYDLINVITKKTNI